MDLIIKINLDNAAFEKDQDTGVADSFKRAFAMLSGAQAIILSPESVLIQDSNGSTVGTVEVTE